MNEKQTKKGCCEDSCCCCCGWICRGLAKIFKSLTGAIGKCCGKKE